MPHNVEIDKLVDETARVRLRRLVQEACRRPTAENLAALDHWPGDWVREAYREFGVRPPLQASFKIVLVPATAESPESKIPDGLSPVKWTFTNWLWWKWFVIWNGPSTKEILK